MHLCTEHYTQQSMTDLSVFNLVSLGTLLLLLFLLKMFHKNVSLKVIPSVAFKVTVLAGEWLRSSMFPHMSTIVGSSTQRLVANVTVRHRILLTWLDSILVCAWKINCVFYWNKMRERPGENLFIKHVILKIIVLTYSTVFHLVTYTTELSTLQ